MSTPNNYREEFLHYIWESRLYFKDNLRTTAGDVLEIVDPGKRNSNAGPDFFNSRIRINGILWIGNVEIHRFSSDWKKHRHHDDPSYNNVILHVVGICDTKTSNSSLETVPTMIIDYPFQLEENYQKLLNSRTWIACQGKIHRIDPLEIKLGFHRLMIGRLEEKTKEIKDSLVQNDNDWDETFYRFVAKMFGFKINALPFELLSKSLPLKILKRHKNNLLQLEALLFGNSGLLNQQLLGDKYYLQLRDEYSHLFRKYRLSGVEAHLWKFMRLRPANFPTIRIAQFASLMKKSDGFFKKIVETETLEEMKTLFRVRTSDYWESHYRFNSSAVSVRRRELGDASINILIINCVVPFLFVFGNDQDKPALKNRALEFLENLPAETNSIITRWKKLGVHCRSAFDTQSLLQLKNRFCESKKCLNCHIGVKLVNKIANK